MHSPLRPCRCFNKSLVLCGSSIFSFIYIVPFLTLHSDINRISIGSSTTLNHVVDPRILILSVSSDLSTSYIPIMNSIFSAQKLVSAPDVHDRTFPKTATESHYRRLSNLRSRNRFLTASCASHRWRLSVPRTTWGTVTVSYCKPFYPKQYPQISYILFKMTFLPPSSIRKVLAIPTQDRIDFRAACFCHKNIIDIGFVCSVCLSSTFTITSSRILPSHNPLYVQYFVNRSQCAPLAGMYPLSQTPLFFLTCFLIEQNSLLKHYSVLMLLALCYR
jgi:hypothetical protein